MKAFMKKVVGTTMVAAVTAAMAAPSALADTVPSVKAKDFTGWDVDDRKLYYHAVLRSAGEVLRMQGKNKQSSCVLDFPTTDHGKLVYDYIHMKTKEDARVSALILEAVEEYCGDL